MGNMDDDEEDNEDEDEAVVGRVSRFHLPRRWDAKWV